MKRFMVCFLFIILGYFPAVAINDEVVGKASTNDSILYPKMFFQSSLSIGLSYLLQTPIIENIKSQPLTLTFSFRILKLIEPAVTLLVGRILYDDEDDNEYVKNMAAKVQVQAINLEIKMSPNVWQWYKPAVGIGWFYSKISSSPGNGNQGLYCLLSLFGFSSEKWALDIKWKNSRYHLQPVICFGDLRYGPFIPWGRRCSDGSGNFYFEVSFFRLGLLWG